MNEDMRAMPITLFRCIYCSLWTVSHITVVFLSLTLNTEHRHFLCSGINPFFTQRVCPQFDNYYRVFIGTSGRSIVYAKRCFSKNPTICEIFFAKSQIRKYSGPKERVDGGKSDVFICWNLLIPTRMIGKSSCKYFNS